MSLYGLKRTPKRWPKIFDSTIVSYGFIHNLIDKSLYIKVYDSIITFACLYVNDMLIISNDMEGNEEFSIVNVQNKGSWTSG